jgi:hypothetical protein
MGRGQGRAKRGLGGSGGWGGNAAADQEKDGEGTGKGVEGTACCGGLGLLELGVEGCMDNPPTVVLPIYP